MFEVFVSDDESVSKYIHEDASETAIKVVNSCSNFMREDGTLGVEWVDRLKYSVFISTSTGCPMKCPFCHLTIKNAAYRRTVFDDLVSNIKEAILCDIERRPDIVTRYVKLCWMGMGDAMFDTSLVRFVTGEILDWIFANKYAVGLDGVDISTVLPIKADGNDIWNLSWLNTRLNAKYADVANPKSHQIEQAEQSVNQEYKGRTLLRLFYSVHSAIQETRDVMVPKALQLDSAADWLFQLQDAGINVMFHQLFIEGLNDTTEEVERLIQWMKQFPKSELRVLRYNFCDRSPHREWTNVDQAIKQLIDNGICVKVQISAGKEVSAACGQFLVAFPRPVK